MHIQLSAMEKDKRLLGQHLEREERVLSDVENRCRGFAAILLAHHDKLRKQQQQKPAAEGAKLGAAAAAAAAGGDHLSDGGAALDDDDGAEGLPLALDLFSVMDRDRTGKLDREEFI